MNVSHLKHDINSGRTGDKSPAFDPAAAPLGTDEEAAGTPLPRAAVHMARAHEVRPQGENWSRQNGVESYETQSPSTAYRAERPRRVNGAWYLAMALMVLGAAIAILWRSRWAG